MAEETENKEQSEQSASPASGEPSGEEQGKQTPAPSGDVDDRPTSASRVGDEEGSEKSRSASRAEGSQAGSESNEGAPVELSDDAVALKEELDKIKVEPPSVVVPEEVFDPAEFPESFKENSAKEKLVLGYAENFRRQYVHLYRDRKPLLLNPFNECGMEKFVCTTLRPTQMPYPRLYDWDGAADFVADYLDFVPLEPPYELPQRLLSPTTVLNRQKGMCFEYSTILCSLLIGAGYDAYVVNGYASREVCLMDETREICPMLSKSKEEKSEDKKKEPKKYSVKPPRDLRSKYEIKMAQRKLKEEQDEQEKLKREEEERQAELEKPPPDPLHGLRIHSWVLVLEGKREVPESFFIEPFTGISHSIKSENYLGIESLWNHQNYWVNMQDCSEGVKNMYYDLGDCTLWEFMFPSSDKPQLNLPDEDELLEGMDDDEKEEEEVEKHLDMPPSWVEVINVSRKDFETRCPKGKKTKLYKRAKLEKFAPYLLKDGLTCRLSCYDDRELSDLAQVKEYYDNRKDKLRERVHNHRTGWVTEYYHPGRLRCLKEHVFKASAPAPENDRTMIFFNEARVDGLTKRLETPGEMTEHFVDRDDFLFYRYVEFGKRPKKFGPAEDTNPRPILKMIEKYHRNIAKCANEDIAEIVFNIQEEKIQVTHHTEDDKVSSSTQEFIKPPNADEKGATLIMTPDMHSSFQVDPTRRQKKNVEVYELMVDLIKAEEKCRERVRESEEEVRDILNDRTREESISELEISVYDTDRNEKAKQRRRELERQQQEEKMRRQDMELDYLAPFLAQIWDPPKITREQAFKLKEHCLADLKQRLINKANLIQGRFESETKELQKKQAWYQQNQVSMQKDDEEEYLNYCSEAMFRIHILELRLNRHKELSPHTFMALDQKIRADPRLSEYF